MSEYDAIELRVTSSFNSFESNRRFNKKCSLTELKEKLLMLTGATLNNMTLELYDKENKFVSKVDDQLESLESLQLQDGMRIHVIDSTIKAGEYEDTTDVEKYHLSDSDYSKRSDSVRAFLERNKMGKYNEENLEMKKQEKEQQMILEEQQAKAITVGSRCEVRLPRQPVKRGEVMFVGEVNFKPGWWVGVKYDEPVGKNDGSLEGQRYFTCEPKYGGFSKPGNVFVGDFPEEDLELDEM